MSDRHVEALAREAGLSVEWENAARQPQIVETDVLRGVLEALGLPCATRAQAEESRERLVGERERAGARFVTGRVGEPIEVRLAADDTTARLTLEDGTARDVHPRTARAVRLPPIDTPGYHRLEIGGQEVTLAVAPRQAFGVADAAERDIWALAVQVYALRGERASGFGDFGDLAACARAAARRGADSLAISPVHALFLADPSRYSPYAPSTRLFLNALYADPRAVFGDHPALAKESGAAGGALVDWEKAGPEKVARFRRLFDAFQEGDGGLRADFESFRREGGERLNEHARFEALHGHFFARDGASGWQGWPTEFHDPNGAAVAQFAREHAREVEFHLFLQWLADRSLAAAQGAAKESGMALGLVADLAVGMDGGGSHAWSRPQDILTGLEVGAPPDLFNPQGQGWGLANFSPLALRANGFDPFLATLRTAMRHAGGVRIDHAMGLQRLWVVPSGASPKDGAYLNYPVDDMLRLIALESQRHRAIVVGEDLGTVPEGFRAKMDETGVLGMRVLWFERDEETEGFLPAENWSREASALTSTHDLPTVAGWWNETDIDWNARLGRESRLGSEAEERRARDADRERLWDACVEAGTAEGAPPSPDAPAPAVDAALGFIATTPCRLAIVPIEDVLGLAEQPNLPGTIDEHPNWRRRLEASAETLFEQPDVAKRFDILTRRREAS